LGASLPEMGVGVDNVKLLYAVGALLGVATVFYFGFRILEDLSPTTTATVILLGFVAFLLAGLYVETETLDTVFYALSAGSYLVFVAYFLAVFEPGDVGVFALLGFSSALFVGLGYGSSQRLLEVERRHAGIGIVVVLIVAPGLVGFDVVGAQPTYEDSFVDSVEVPDGEGDRMEAVVVGEVTGTNGFAFSRRADPPDYRGCLYSPERRTFRLGYSESTGGLILGGGESRTFELVVRESVFYERDGSGGEPELGEGLRDLGSVPVESAEDCPEETDEVKLVVVPDDEAQEGRPVPP